MKFFRMLIMIVGLVAMTGGELRAADDADIITPLINCPAARPACMTFHIYLTTPEVNGEGLTEYTALISLEVEKFDEPIVADVLGRLNGGAEKRHRVAFPNGRGEMICQDSFAATVGVSKNGRGTILTDRGELEITDPTIEIGVRDVLALIDRESMKRTELATPQWQGHFYTDDLAFTKQGRVYWRQNGVCLDIDSGPRFKQVPAEKCRSAKRLPASASDVARVRKTGMYDDDHAKDYLQNYLFRIEGSHYLTYIWPVACT